MNPGKPGARRMHVSKVKLPAGSVSRKLRSDFLLLWLVLVAQVVQAQDPNRASASPADSMQYNTSAPQAALPPVTPPSEGVLPDPAVTSVGPAAQAARLPAPTPPPAADNCDTADCPGSGSKPSVTKPKYAPVHIGEPAQRALSQSYDWAENPAALPSRDAVGRVMFPFSQSAPTLVCAPVHVCDLELQAGEVVQGAPHVGDSVRWRISPAVSGSDEKRITHLIIKPTEAGLDTNLIIPTDRHTYHIRLVSSSTRYLASAAFYYPDEEQTSWAEQGKATRPAGAQGSESTDMPSVAVNRLNFNYKIKVVKGSPRFRPLRAMDDGYHTYISMSEDLLQSEAPVLVGVTSNGTEQVINYRLKGNLYVVDGTVYKLALISGVGRQQERIELTRDPCKARGWLGICWDAQE
jgi:P-type conjugative transfer protein TrbG